ncbi:hypothetical protein AC249_AIPGENE7820 [Exaiptasia diaphana]|nr:hypothetical protein AC249_AIPGENE7820 [Exaiptasia diaphana]
MTKICFLLYIGLIVLLIDGGSGYSWSAKASGKNKYVGRDEQLRRMKASSDVRQRGDRWRESRHQDDKLQPSKDDDFGFKGSRMELQY